MKAWATYLAGTTTTPGRQIAPAAVKLDIFVIKQAKKNIDDRSNCATKHIEHHQSPIIPEASLSFGICDMLQMHSFDV